MKNIYSDLWIGSAQDYENDIKYKNDWKVVQAAKDPYHRKAVAYLGELAITHPEYLYCIRDRHMILNMIDANNYIYINEKMVDEALEFINTGLYNNYKVLIHCNQGYSRAPTLGFLYLLRYTDVFETKIFAEACQKYQHIYPSYNPGNGLLEFMMYRWDKYSEKL